MLVTLHHGVQLVLEQHKLELVTLNTIFSVVVGFPVGVTFWKLKSHIFKALVLPTFTYGIENWGNDLKNSH